MSIREANVKDANEIAKIHVKAWQVGYKEFMPKEYLDSLSVESKKNNMVRSSHKKRPWNQFGY